MTEPCNPSPNEGDMLQAACADCGHSNTNHTLAGTCDICDIIAVIANE